MKVKYKILVTGEVKSTDKDTLERMLIIDSRCPGRSIELADKKFNFINGKIVGTGRASNTGNPKQSEERGTTEKGV